MANMCPYYTSIYKEIYKISRIDENKWSPILLECVATNYEGGIGRQVWIDNNDAEYKQLKRKPTIAMSKLMYAKKGA
ncbi:hypothetical protein [Aquamicrobium sp.]|uniref:hypothetical protein n=1 Tax=Aquamicrobium sp. TaxID=1872579 RepID=UPI00258C60BA|nr:hypothetical protein [Aquamicrobium sp.]MCK9551155.1 hypothetical protein [Aquamicrobium sp.]